MADDTTPAKPKGEHPIRRLERENKEKAEEIARLTALLADKPTAVEQALSAPPITETVGVTLPDDEMAFVEQVLVAAASRLDFKGTDLVKRIYTHLDTSLRVLRVVREQVGKSGPGAPLPAFGTLGLNSSTGLPVTKGVQPVAVPAPVPAARAPAAPRSAPPDALQRMAQALRQGIAGDMAQRAEKQPVAAAS